MSASKERIAAIIAAAGRSRRMGEPKQLLPWGNSTVIATVARNLTAVGADPVLCVTGHRADDIASALTTTKAHIHYNPGYITTDMLRSYQTGIERLLDQDMGVEVGGEQVVGTLLALGDQPHIPIDVLQQIVAQARQTPDQIVIPSFNMRRGHPFYFPRCFWAELLDLGDDETLRVIVKRHEDAICYVNVDDDAILRDMDTPEVYAVLRDEWGGERGRSIVGCFLRGGPQFGRVSGVSSILAQKSFVPHLESVS